MKLKDLCVLDAVCCLPDTTVTAAAQLMRQKHVGDLIVVDNDDDEREPIGMVADRDIVIEVVSHQKNPNMTAVRDIMTRQVVIAASDEDVDVALERMRTHGVRRLPIVDFKGFIIGIVTLDDLLKAHAEEGAALAEIVSKGQRRESRGKRVESRK